MIGRNFLPTQRMSVFMSRKKLGTFSFLQLLCSRGPRKIPNVWRQI